MKVAVCIKQVPGTNKVEVDPVTGVLKRNGVESKMNPYDLYAIEAAMRIKETCGAEIYVITMGPGQAQSVIKEAYSLGCDKGYLISDRAFAGADVLATSRAISQGIKTIGDFDLIICGKQSTDGDTAQVGPAISEWLNLPFVTNVKKIIDVNTEKIIVERELSTAVQTLELTFPCLVSIEKDIYIPRLPSYIKKQATKDREINVITLNELKDKNEKNYGLSGSPTQVQRIFPPEVNSDREMWIGDAEELSGKIKNRLKELKFI